MKDCSLTNSEILTAVKKADPAKGRNVRNDIGLSQLFADIFGVCCRFNTTARQWYRYDGKRWALDECGVYALKCMRQLARALFIYAADQDESYQKFVAGVQKKQARKTVIEDAQALIHFSSADLDSNRALVNFQNGTLNVDSMEFKEHDPEDLLSRVTNCDYDPEATDPRWIEFITVVMSGDAGKMRYFQQLLGYTLTGLCNEDIFVLLFGPSTRNGKSTLMGALVATLGDYARTINPDVLAQRQRNGEGPNGSIADLRGALLGVAEEPSKQMTLDAALIKSMTGGSIIRARYLNENFFEFRPRFTLFMCCNSLPQVTDSSLFDSGRIRVVPFLRHFSAEEQDKTLRDTLSRPEVQTAMCAWIIEGLKDYQQNGFVIPDSVADAGSSYANNCDKIDEFIDDTLDPDPAAVLSGGEVYEKYRDWCVTSGYCIDSKRDFFEALRRRNVFYDHGTVNGKTLKNVMRGYSFAS